MTFIFNYMIKANVTNNKTTSQNSRFDVLRRTRHYLCRISAPPLPKKTTISLPRSYHKEPILQAQTKGLSTKQMAWTLQKCLTQFKEGLKTNLDKRRLKTITTMLSLESKNETCYKDLLRQGWSLNMDYMLKNGRTIVVYLVSWISFFF